MQVTEKFFQSLVAGSVPVVIGAPNVKFYAPDTTPYPYESSSMIYCGDYGDNAETIAKMLLEFDTNAAAYNRMLEWKVKGYSDDFKALMDLTDVHSSCRVCISIADERRNILGANVYDVRKLVVIDVDNGAVTPAVDAAKFALYIRERGAYALRRLEFAQRPSFVRVVEAILKHLPVREKNVWKDNEDKRNKPVRVYALYTPRTRLPVLGELDVACVVNGAELEVIFV